ncbi:SMI1/KNR4 family protein [Nonomuraea jiangxiensis]|uniref:SMI1-KNR4 cell-wall n=1 Tax=Nonomuraea jiangxiensis TaxID=633440 RepID=A0A1G8QLQ4_9ACTN|nr:SMI1/KNR4 family protein [Nonomuraea jiangxiensis]SDJ05729.1 SMI1-KNR4 cell-wall [Nonomuraea jiangxiensis]
MNPHDWDQFLKRWTEEWLIAHPDLAGELTAGWPGYPPASTEQIATLEQRLGRPLPPSYRDFLQASNGWRFTIPFVDELRGANDVGWLCDLDPSMAEIYDDSDIFEEEAAILHRAVLISLEADAGIIVLDPDDVNADGEWAVHELFSWSGEPTERHKSFYEWMYDSFASFHTLDRPSCRTQREWDDRIEQARLASLAGQVDAPLHTLEQAHRFGRDRAGILYFQLRVMLGIGDREASQWIEHPLTDTVNKNSTWELDEPLLATEFLPVLFDQHSRINPHLTQSCLAGFYERGIEPVKRLIIDHRDRRKEPGFQLSYGNPEFDAAVRAIDFAGPDAWPLLHDALPLWRPVSDDHLAPICLMADPRIAPLITPERGREILSTPRG